MVGEPQEERSYYSIGEVAKMFAVDEAQLRYWEQHTPLSPQRSTGSGARMYTKTDLELVERIRFLLQDRGLSLSAVNKQLERGAVDPDLEMRQKLLTIRDKVEGLRRIVQQHLQQNQADVEN